MNVGNLGSGPTDSMGGVADTLDANGFKIGDNDITIAVDAAIKLGVDTWSEMEGAKLGVNILTLIRNALSAYDADGSGKTALEQFKSEINISGILIPRIRDDIANLSMYMDDVHKVKVTVYGIKYDSLYLSGMPNYRKAKTDKQIATKAIVDSVLRAMNVDITYYNDKIPGNIGYIISHVPYDILVSSSQTKVVESHTGRIKTRSELNTKLRLTDDEKFIVPFNTITYLLYGDGVLLNKNTKLTRAVLNVLVKGRITPMSTATRFSMAIKNNDPILSRAISAMTRSG